ncbi:MAG: flippase-like domain-containing protein [Bacteroidales bacterium]|nr:flippase-like domain-containing protein [Bacteroidales bacterium]
MKKQTYRLIKSLAGIIIAAAFYYYLYRLSVPHFQNIKELEQITDFNNFGFKYLFMALFLCFPNWILESVKWQTAVMPIEKINIKTAIKGVLRGVPPSTFTPNRIGETVGRATVLQPSNRVQGAFATAYCGISQMPVMAMSAAAGALWLALQGVNIQNAAFITSWWFAAAFAFIAAAAAAIFYKPTALIPAAKNRWQRLTAKLEFFGSYTPAAKHRIIIISALRYCVYSIQNYLLLKTFGINIGIADGMAAVFVIYGIISFVPRPALAELGVRCSVSAVVLQPFTQNPLVPAASSAVLWIINILIPCIIGTVLYFVSKKSEKIFAD